MWTKLIRNVQEFVFPQRFAGRGAARVRGMGNFSTLGKELHPALDGGQAGLHFSADDDGKYRYGLWTDDFGIILAVDADEVRKASLRIEPAFAVLLTVRYRGGSSLSINPGNTSLEFVKHYRELRKAVDPDEFAVRLRKDADAFAQETQREIRKHPERKAEKQSILQMHEKDVGETEEFLKSRGLRAVKLDAVNTEATGWVFFSVKSKWIGDWKKQEEFIFRIPLAEQTIEFPFALPPSQGDLLLRRRLR